MIDDPILETQTPWPSASFLAPRLHLYSMSLCLSRGASNSAIHKLSLPQVPGASLVPSKSHDVRLFLSDSSRFNDGPPCKGFFFVGKCHRVMPASFKMRFARVVGRILTAVLSFYFMLPRQHEVS